MLIRTIIITKEEVLDLRSSWEDLAEVGRVEMGEND